MILNLVSGVSGEDQAVIPHEQVTSAVDKPRKGLAVSCSALLERNRRRFCIVVRYIRPVAAFTTEKNSPG